MLSSWRSKCFLNRPAKLLDACKNRGWLYRELTRPFLQCHGFTVMREQYNAAHVRRNERCRKSLFNGPIRCKSMTKGSLGYTYPFGPVFQAHGFTVKSKHSGLSSVVLLLFSSCPAAVGWFVVAVLVRVSVKCCVGRSRPHICQESEKRIPPPFADGYSSPAVSVISSGARTIATRFHHFPRIVFRASACGVSASFRLITRCNRIAYSHLKLLHSFMVVRAEAVVVDRFGSFYCATPHKVVQ